MHHLSSHLVEFLAVQASVSRSRRGLLRSGLGLGIALVEQCVVQPVPAQAALTVQVAAPRITRTDDCQATVSVAVILEAVSEKRRYHLYGDVLEAETDENDAEFCCALRPRHALLLPGLTRSVTLTQQAMAVDLGLVRGLGPAANETFSPDLVELFARIWLHDLATDEVLGPWDSPQRIAVSRSLPGVMPPASLQANPLMTLRGSASATITASDSRRLPPLPCSS